MEGSPGEVGADNMLQSTGVVPRAVAQIFTYLQDNDLEYQVLHTFFCTLFSAELILDSGSNIDS